MIYIYICILHVCLSTYIFLHINIYKYRFLYRYISYCTYYVLYISTCSGRIFYPVRIRCDLLWPATSGQAIFQTLPFLFLEQREIIPLLSRCGHHMPANSFAILHSPPFVANPQRIHTSHRKYRKDIKKSKRTCYVINSKKTCRDAKQTEPTLSTSNT